MRKRWPFLLAVGMAASIAAASASTAAGDVKPPLGLPPVPIPADNPMTKAKIELGEKLFNDLRFSTTGKVACATCHAAATGMTDSPKVVSEGIDGFTGTRNAPTVLNSAYMTTLFWDGRSPSLEDQALHPFVNPVEMGLKDHEPILKICRTDPAYTKAFRSVFGKSGNDITMKEVTQAIAAFERTKLSGGSAFDRYYFAGETGALTQQQLRGFGLFVGQGRCNSCHVIEQTTALFTDNKFHNVGIGINAVQAEVPRIAAAFLEADLAKAEVDVKVLTDSNTSQLGRFVVDRTFQGIGAFKTPSLRDIAATPPYMHDGSLATLRDVVVHYNNGGVTKAGDRVNDFLASGIRPLNLTEAQIDDLVAFMESLTSPEQAKLAEQAKASASAGAAAGKR